MNLPASEQRALAALATEFNKLSLEAKDAFAAEVSVIEKHLPWIVFGSMVLGATLFWGFFG